MGTLLFNRVLNGVLNGISARACSIPKRFDSQPYVKCLSDFFCGPCGPAAAPLIAFGKTLASDISAFKLQHLQPPLCNYSHSFAMTFKFVAAPRYNDWFLQNPCVLLFFHCFLFKMQYKMIKKERRDSWTMIWHLQPHRTSLFPEKKGLCANDFISAFSCET